MSFHKLVVKELNKKRGKLVPISGGYWAKVWTNLGEFYHMATYNQTLTPKCMFLDYGTKPEYPEKTNTCTYG